MPSTTSSTTASPPPTGSGIQTLPTGDRHIPASTRADGSLRKEIKIRPGYRPPEDVEVYKNRTAEAWKTKGTGGVPGAAGLQRDGSGGGAADDEKSGAAGKNAKRREARKRAKAAGGGVGGGGKGEEEGVNDGGDDEEGKEAAESNSIDVATPIAETTPSKPAAAAAAAAAATAETKPTKNGSPAPNPSAAARHSEKNEKKNEKKEDAAEAEAEAELEKQARALKKKLRQARDLKAKKDSGEGLLPEQFAKVIKIQEIMRQLDALGFDGDGARKARDVR